MRTEIKTVTSEALANAGDHIHPSSLSGAIDKFLSEERLHLALIEGFLYQRNKWIFQESNKFNAVSYPEVDRLRTSLGILLDTQRRFLLAAEVQGRKSLYNQDWGLAFISWSTKALDCYVDLITGCGVTYGERVVSDLEHSTFIVSRLDSYLLFLDVCITNPQVYPQVHHQINVLTWDTGIISRRRGRTC